MAKKTPKPATKTKTKAPFKKIERIEIKLGPDESKAFDLAHSSVELRSELEEAVTLAIAQAVRKVFKQHGVSLTTLQAQELALVLFGE